MSAAAIEQPTTVQEIIVTHHAGLMKDVASFLALSLFITAVLIWAY
ncbi:conserved hypothetical protein [Agrobacterium tumefaciens str. Kerr 14]|uniref:Uncharacterized protein n=1 Tax=Agrobacterium tumefaciens str. Kerr 14 TaxID=1183424 RepID=A0A1S7NL93_AGRTU|nr:hypothetical protein [Agrobacterium tumefaciens]CUX08681.1 conserved hypothetical protein [Agrobacterium tumefaciens str. Kerr 14]